MAMMFSFSEPANGFAGFLYGNKVAALPNHILDAQLKLQAKRKLALILKSKSTFNEHVKTGDMDEVYRRTGMDKRGVWLTRSTFLSINHDDCSVVVSGKDGKKTVVSIKDAQPVILEESFPSFVQSVIDELHNDINGCVRVSNSVENITPTHQDDYRQRSGAAFSDFGAAAPTDVSKNSNAADKEKINDTPTKVENPDTSLFTREERMSVYWSHDSRFYLFAVEEMHRSESSTVNFDKHDKERLILDSGSMALSCF